MCLPPLGGAVQFLLHVLILGEAGQTRKGNTTWDHQMSPWERRKRGGLYYTRSRKVDGRLVRE